jgi:ArsR family transcriptional regulator
MPSARRRRDRFPSGRRLLRVQYFDDTGNMEMKSDKAIVALGALAQEHRLAVFRLLVQAGPDGKAAGDIAVALDLPASSLSFHLGHLTRAGLITQRRESRSLIYSADFVAMNRLVGFLTENCCGGASCAPATAPSKKKAS